MNTLSDLTKMGQVPIDMTLDGLAAVRRQEAADAISLADSQRKYLQEMQMDPLRVKQQQTANDISLEQLASQRRGNREADFVSPVKMLSDYKGYLAKAGDDDIKLATQQAQQMAFSRDPAVAERGRALLGATKEFLLQKQKDAADLDKVRQQGADQRQLMQMQIDAGRFDKAGKYAMSLESRLRMAKNAKEKAEILEQGYQEAQAAGDGNLAAIYLMRAQEARQRAAEDEANRMAKPGQIDTPAVGGLPAIPPPTATAPIGGGNPQQAPKAHSLVDLRKMYPGRSDADIKAAYKAKFGVEPQ